MTAEQIIKEDTSGVYNEADIAQMMIKFAKFHVEEALNAVYNSSISDITEWSGNSYSGEGSDYLCLDKIKKQYSLTNIK